MHDEASWRKINMIKHLLPKKYVNFLGRPGTLYISTSLKTHGKSSKERLMVANGLSVQDLTKVNKKV